MFVNEHLEIFLNVFILSAEDAPVHLFFCIMTETDCAVLFPDSAEASEIQRFKVFYIVCCRSMSSGMVFARILCIN